MMRGRLPIAALALLAVACAGQATAAPALPTEEAGVTYRNRLEHPPAPPVDPRPRFTGFAETFHDDVSLAAMAKGALDVFETPEHPEPLMVLPEINIIGSTTVVALVGEPADGWAEVSLPVRPNGTTGWIRLDQVDLFVVSGHIVVDLSDRSLVYYQSGREVLSAEIGIGSAHSPTPTGRFYVTDSVTLTKKGTPWGPHALGLSARSDRITSFNGGDGIIGIHGTSTPASIGGAVSMGCVRLDNDKITRLHDLVPLGTPVEIRA